MLWLTDCSCVLASFAVRSSWWNWTKMEDQRIQRRLTVCVLSSRWRPSPSAYYRYPVISTVHWHLSWLPISLQDLSSKDLKRDLYIVAHVIRTGKSAQCPKCMFNGRSFFMNNTHLFLLLFCPGRMLLNDSKKGPPHVQYRRPYGCAVLAMSDVFHTITDLKEEKDFVLKVYTWV